jgi:DNA topoisomerase-2
MIFKNSKVFLKPKMKKQTYIKKDPISHILDRPDMYVGSTKSRSVEEFVITDYSSFQIEKRTVHISPAILRIFIEPLSNIIDNVARSKTSKHKVTKILIDINKETGETSFYNDGEVIPIEIHSEEKCYNHTMIFGHLLTSSNYDDEQDREDISGRNGLGVKLCSVFSTFFNVEGGDPDNKKTFSQTWRNNMRIVEEPIVKSNSKAKRFTKVSFIPDFKQFGLKGYTDDILSLYYRFVADCAMITKVSVVLNGKALGIKDLISYAKLYNNQIEEDDKEHVIEYDEDKEETESVTSTSKPKKQHLLIKTQECEVFLCPSNGDFQAISFANGVYTPLGGTHVDAWTESIFRPIIEKLNKAGKPQINISDIKKYFRLFVVATVKKPEFDSQSKTKLEAPQITAEVKKSHISNITRWNIMETLKDLIRTKEMMVLKKTERKKRGHERVEGLDPANNEGSAKAHECTLILVEGLSAKTYASWGIQRGAFGKKGRDWFGIYALRGKVKNCRNAKPITISKNKVVSDIIKALGIQYGVDYSLDENWKNLRYGRVLIVSDSDVDGLHISGLIQNMFHALFPSLLKRTQPYITAMQTPIVRVYLGKTDKLFYDEREYHDYVKKMNGKKINKKYYKGLGSSNEKDVTETFGQKLVLFKEDEKTTENMNKAFHDKHAEMRKKWLEQYDPNDRVLSWSGNIEEKKTITFSDYINTELIKFSIDDCKRSIPHIMDGLKEGHRKVLYVTFIRNLKYTGKTIKVAQLAGSVSEKAAYHHGEQNLEKTMTGMADNYVGSNNIPLLFRDGQYGSRSEGGTDAASGRYIWTKLDCLTRLIFREEDDCLLDYIEDDGESIEPRFYVPIIPMILVNGSLGIGTGWSSTIPCYNPLDLIQCVKDWLNNDCKAFEIEEDITISLLPELKPWYKGHNGQMTSSEDDQDKFISWGCLERDNKGKVVITELPVGVWTDNFKEELEKLKEDKKIKNYKNYSTPKKINFVITENDQLKCNLETLKLSKVIRTSNMVVFTEENKLKKFKTPQEIVDEFCKVRFRYYTLRKTKQLNQLKHQLKVLGNKKRFLIEVRDGIIKLFEENNRGGKQSRKTSDLINELTEGKYDMIDDSYDYLLTLQINSITAEKIDILERDIANRTSEYNSLLSTNEKAMWTSELDEFQVEYLKWLEKEKLDNN